jgi:hypothetical protein
MPSTGTTQAEGPDFVCTELDCEMCEKLRRQEDLMRDMVRISQEEHKKKLKKKTA